MGLIFLEGGPLDGSAYDTKDLLGQPESALPHGYVWTSAKRTSARTGASAQVWKFVGDPLLLPPPEDTDLTADQLGAMLDSGQPVELPLGAAPDAPPPSAATRALDEPDWRVRRDAIGATRKTVCEATGLKPSRLFAIEAGTGKPVTAQERQALDTALARLEADASAH